MIKHTATMMILAITLTACAAVRESRLNPSNWFERTESEIETVTVTEERRMVDGRVLADQVISMNVDPFPGGAIIRAVGLPPTQGFWDAELLLLRSDDPTELIFEFRMTEPPTNQPQNTQASREIIAGVSVSDARLDGVAALTVVGARNRRSIRR